MANLRSAFLQAYHSGNPFFFFLTGLPCILQSLLTCEDKTHHQGKPSIASKDNKRQRKIQKINQQRFEPLYSSLCTNKMQISTLHQIMSNESCDFKNQKQNGSFAHAMELLLEDDQQRQFNDIETVFTEYQSVIGQVPDSTQISAMSQMDCSDIQDFQIS